MPELPDITVYITALEPGIIGEPIEHVRLASPFLTARGGSADRECLRRTLR